MEWRVGTTARGVKDHAFNALVTWLSNSNFKIFHVTNKIDSTVNHLSTVILKLFYTHLSEVVRGTVLLISTGISGLSICFESSKITVMYIIIKRNGIMLMLQIITIARDCTWASEMGFDWDTDALGATYYMGGLHLHNHLIIYHTIKKRDHERMKISEHESADNIGRSLFSYCKNIQKEPLSKESILVMVLQWRSGNITYEKICL